MTALDGFGPYTPFTETRSVGVPAVACPVCGWQNRSSYGWRVQGQLGSGGMYQAHESSFYRCPECGSCLLGAYARWPLVG